MKTLKLLCGTYDYDNNHSVVHGGTLQMSDMIKLAVPDAFEGGHFRYLDEPSKLEKLDVIMNVIAYPGKHGDIDLKYQKQLYIDKCITLTKNIDKDDNIVSYNMNYDTTRCNQEGLKKFFEFADPKPHQFNYGTGTMFISEVGKEYYREHPDVPYLTLQGQVNIFEDGNIIHSGSLGSGNDSTNVYYNCSVW